MLRHVIFILSTLFFFNASATEPISNHQQSITKDIDQNFAGVALGNEDAQIIITDYSSFSCGGCQYFFKEVVSRMKEEYIDTGKVKFIMHDFPLDFVSLKASLLIRYYQDKFPASKKDHDATLNLISKLFNVAARLGNAENFDKKLYEIARDDMHLSKNDFETAINNNELKKQILNEKLYAIKELKLRGTPTIYINSKKYTGKLSLKNFQEEVDALLRKNSDSLALNSGNL